jgi:hypothetical protein
MEQVMSNTNTIETDNQNFKAHDRILGGLLGLCLVAAAVGVLSLLGSF